MRAPRRAFTAQWNDDFHHVVAPSADRRAPTATTPTTPQRPLALLGRCLAEGFALPGRGVGVSRSASRAASRARMLPPEAFVNFLQNHDQVGNRAFGERLHALAPAGALRGCAARSCCSRPRSRCCSWARSSARAIAVPVLLRLRSASSRPPCAPVDARSSRAFRRSTTRPRRSPFPIPARERRSRAARSTGAASRTSRMRRGSRSIASCWRFAAERIVPLVPHIAGAAAPAAGKGALDVGGRSTTGARSCCTLRCEQTRYALPAAGRAEICLANAPDDEWTVRWASNRAAMDDVPTRSTLVRAHGIATRTGYLATRARPVGGHQARVAGGDGRCRHRSRTGRMRDTRIAGTVGRSHRRIADRHSTLRVAPDAAIAGSWRSNPARSDALRRAP